MGASGSLAALKTISGCCSCLLMGSGQVGVFVEYTPLPDAKFPTQLEQSYAALQWIAAHAERIRR